MRLSDLRSLPARQWLVAVFGAILVVFLVAATVWTGRHAWTIFKLNRGVGDTVFYDAGGRPWFRLDEQRRDVQLEQISTYFKDAIVAVEDHRFYLHPGIDPIALARAVVYNLSGGDGTQGGSTITQQLARTLFLSNTRTYGRKVKEAALAVLLEVFLSKREILQLYMNRVFLSGGIYGVETMSQKLLRKPAAKLTLAEAALIAGIIRRPSSYSPWSHFDAARRRSFVVLQRMREEGKITAAEEQTARNERIRIQPQPAVTSAKHGFAKEYLRQQFRDIYGGDNPPDWKVHTTFVPEFQDAAEASVREGLRRLGAKGLQAALVAMDPQTGNLLAMVGGSDFATTTFNRAVRSRRQPGSAFKPFVYAAALERGLSPLSMIVGLQQVAIACARRRLDSAGRARERAQRNDAAGGAPRVEQRGGRAAAAAGGQCPGAAPRPGSRRAGPARRPVAGARQRAGVAARPHGGVRGVSHARLPRAAARRWCRWRTRPASACTRCTSNVSGSCRSRWRSRWSPC